MSNPDAADYLPTVEVIAKTVWKRYAKSLAGYMEWRDLYQHGIVALYEAADRYDSTAGATFRTYMGTRVHGAMLDYFYDDPSIPVYKKTRVPKTKVWIEPLPLEDEQRIPFELSDRQRPHDPKLLSTMLARLTARQFRALYLRYYEGRDYWYIGKKMGVIESRAWQICDEAIAKLKSARPSVDRSTLIAQMVDRKQRAMRYYDGP